MQKEQNDIYKKIQTILQSLITAALIGCFKFLWDLNATVASMKSESASRATIVNNVQQGINNLQMDMQDVRGRVIRLETRETIPQPDR